MNLLIVIPCYNHQQSCSKLVSLIDKNNDILIIDDGSDNDHDFINIKNAFLHKNKSNHGKGYCIKYGAEYALKNNYTHILTIDADLQHDPIYINNFIKISKDRLIVYGKREFYMEMPYLRKLSNTITSYIISKFCNVNIYDSQCGYRLYNLEVFKTNTFIEDSYIFESEVLIKSINNLNQIDYVEIDTIYNNSSSNINKVRETINFIKLIIANANIYVNNR